MKQTLFRMWVYFKHGHTGWLAFALSLFNFMTIQYKLLIESIPALDVLFPSFWTFLITFSVLYPTLAMALGYIDFKKGTMPAHYTITTKTNPYNQALMQALLVLVNDPNKRAQIHELFQPLLVEDV